MWMRCFINAALILQEVFLLLSALYYDIKYRKADKHGNADGLSRLPLPGTATEPTQAEIFSFKEVTAAPVTSTQVKKHTHTDPIMSEVISSIAGGEMTLSLKPYLVRRNELSVQSGWLLWGYRIIIPLPQIKKVLDGLHSGHCGVVRMKEIAHSYFCWPGLDAAIEEKAKSCPACQKLRNLSQLAPLHPWDWPEEPWQRVHIDFAGPLENHMFLVVIDAHRKWPEVAIMKLVSDNGPHLVSEEFKTFMEENGMQHIESAPYHPATNGLAEICTDHEASSEVLSWCSPSTGASMLSCCHTETHLMLRQRCLLPLQETTPHST